VNNCFYPNSAPIWQTKFAEIMILFSVSGFQLTTAEILICMWISSALQSFVAECGDISLVMSHEAAVATTTKPQQAAVGQHLVNETDWKIGETNRVKLNESEIKNIAMKWKNETKLLTLCFPLLPIGCF